MGLSGFDFGTKVCYIIIIMNGQMNGQIFRVDNRIVQEADDLAKETHLTFRDCLEMLIRVNLQDSPELPTAPSRSS